MIKDYTGRNAGSSLKSAVSPWETRWLMSHTCHMQSQQLISELLETLTYSLGATAGTVLRIQLRVNLSSE